MIIKQARESAGMTMQELAEAVGVSAAAICRYERGIRTPKVAIAKKIAKVLGLPWYAVIDNEEGKEASA